MVGCGWPHDLAYFHRAPGAGGAPRLTEGAAGVGMGSAGPGPARAGAAGLVRCPLLVYVVAVIRGDTDEPQLVPADENAGQGLLGKLACVFFFFFKGSSAFVAVAAAAVSFS